jgi:hypothetical protein
MAAFTRKIPDLTTTGRMVALAVAVSVISTAILLVQNYAWMPGALGDTDDATRIVMVRELLAGRGWWDQHWMRFQPPDGVYMHWSRLLDGAIALLNLLFRIGLDNRSAEIATRIVWPWLCMIPAVWATLSATRRLAIDAGRPDRAQSAVIAATALMIINLGLFSGQFRPGRVDHHNVQIALALVAMAGAMEPSHRRAAALLAGMASGLGLAIGLEALFFQVAIAGMVAFRFVRDPAARRWVQTYMVAMAATMAASHAIQSPPDRWLVSACDAMAVNLVGAVLAGAGTLCVLMHATRTRDSRFRAAAALVAGVSASLVYVLVQPACLHGPFAEVDPRIRSFWLDHVNEVANLPTLFRRNVEQALYEIATAAAGCVALLVLMVNARRLPGFAFVTAVLLLAMSVAIGMMAVRMSVYASWFATPLIAVAATSLAKRYEQDLGLAFAGLGAALVLTPAGWSGISTILYNALPNVVASAAPKTAKGASAPGKATAKDPPDYCFNAFPYKPLASAPKGLTVSEIDLGPFVIAHTPSSSLSGPYHRLSIGIMAARSVLTSKPDLALQRVRQLGVTYVLACPLHANHADRSGLDRDALQSRLDRGEPPAWLQPMTKPHAPVMIYRVEAPAKTQ